VDPSHLQFVADEYSGAAAGLGILGVLLIILGAAGYFLPTIIALARRHPSTGFVVVINLFLGWTLVGWVWALARALDTKYRGEVTVNVVAPPGYVAQPAAATPDVPVAVTPAAPAVVTPVRTAAPAAPAAAPFASAADLAALVSQSDTAVTSAAPTPRPTPSASPWSPAPPAAVQTDPAPVAPAVPAAVLVEDRPDEDKPAVVEESSAGAPCASCGTALPAEARFCMGCGAVVNGNGSESAPEEPAERSSGDTETEAAVETASPEATGEAPAEHAPPVEEVRPGDDVRPAVAEPEGDRPEPAVARSEADVDLQTAVPAPPVAQAGQDGSEAAPAAQPATAAPDAGAGFDGQLAEKLRQLAALREDGSISEEQYRRLRKNALDHF
jgi:hypothetical protein